MIDAKSFLVLLAVAVAIAVAAVTVTIAIAVTVAAMGGVYAVEDERFIYVYRLAIDARP